MLTKKQKIFLVIYTILLITYHYDQYKKAEFEMEMKYRHSKVVEIPDGIEYEIMSMVDSDYELIVEKGHMW